MKVTQVNLEATRTSLDAGRPSLTPELLAATGARYSRSNDGLEAIRYFIYALCDPCDGKIRYVGITRQAVKKRLAAHLKLARNGAQLHCSCWLRQLLQKGLRPQIMVLEETGDATREVFWIERCRQEGCHLTNGTSGGISGYFHSPEVRAKIAHAGQKRFKDLTGQQIGRLTVIEVAAHSPLSWICECSCGQRVVVKAQSFSSKGVQSCGCLSRELSAERARSRSKHGLWRSKEYLTWIEMRARCNNPNHSRYGCNGALGIQVCPQWQGSFERFLSDMGQKPEVQVLLRKHKAENYCPENCCWGTKSELRRQKR